MDQTISKAESAILHTYNRYDLVLEKGDGAYLYDTDGKAYLDFGSGIGVSSLGYGNKTLQSALKKQIDQLIHTSNLYYHEPLAQAAEKLKTISGMDRVFFANSGTEAIEGALKTARKYAKQKGNSACEIISMEHSFHGRSMGALSVTGTESYREPFEPLVGGVKFAIFNDLESVKEQVTEKTGAILLEPVQGEGGVFVAEQSFLQGLRTLCEEKGILLIFDEIQCGMGRTGSIDVYKRQFPDVPSQCRADICFRRLHLPVHMARYSHHRTHQRCFQYIIWKRRIILRVLLSRPVLLPVRSRCSSRSVSYTHLAGMNLDSNSEIGIGAPNKYPCAEGHPIEVRSAACSSFSMPSAMTSTGSSLHI